ncbi:MAG TPA: methyltransferase, partial [Steroidobacteraceae bacterium]
MSELLFPGGDGSTLSALYRRTPAAQALNTVLRQGLLAALARLPQRSGVRILEIGAGTGGSSASLLPHLGAARTEYVFTDISSAFIKQAEVMFADYPFVQYQTLDIERDPEAQGFASHGYDFVLASNVLHATEDLARTLAHTRRLLAPGGMVLLLEGTDPQRWVDLTFGMTSGWWRFRDKQLRPSHPLLSAQQWRELLDAYGFQQAGSAECAPIHQSVILARADAKPDADHAAEHWLIFADATGIAPRLSELIRAAGSTCALVYPSSRYARTDEDVLTIDPTRADHYQRLLEDICATELRHCVHLWGLDAKMPGNDCVSPVFCSRPCWESTLLVLQALGKAGLAPRLSLVTRGAISVSGEAVPGIAASPLWGMGKTIALEQPELHCLRIDLAPEPQPDEVSALMAELAREISPPTEDQIAFRGEHRYVARLTRRGFRPDEAAQAWLDLPRTESCALAAPVEGTLDGLSWQPSLRRAPAAGEVEILVRSAALNFKDVLLALQMVPAVGPVLGGECAGEVVAVGTGVTSPSVGDAVLAMAPGSFARHVTVPAHAVARLPAGLGFEAAATIPVAFLTAVYALRELAKLRAGERILIHAVSGGVGQAAIQIAQAAGAE